MVMDMLELGNLMRARLQERMGAPKLFARTIAAQG